MDLYTLPLILQTAGVVLGNAYWNDWDAKIREEINKRMSRKRSMSAVLSGDVSSSSSQAHLSEVVGDTKTNIDASQSIGVAGGTSVVGTASIARMSSMGSVGSQHVNIVDTPSDDISTRQDISGEQGMHIEIAWPHPPQSESDMQLVSQHHAGAGGVAVAEFTDLKHMDEHNQKAFLDARSKDELVALCMSQLKQLDKLRKSLDASIKTRRYWNQVARRLDHQLQNNKERLQSVRNQNPNDDDLQIKPKNRRRMNWKGMITLGLRKGMTLVSANAFPQASLLDVSRQSVYRAEILCGAYFITRMFAFHQLLYTLLKTFASIQQESHNPTIPINADSDSMLVLVNTETQGGAMNYQTSQDDMLSAELGVPSGQPVTFQKMLLTVHGKSAVIGSTYFCGDATNSSIWQRQKLQGLMVKSALLTDWDAIKNMRYQNAFSCMTSMFPN